MRCWISGNLIKHQSARRARSSNYKIMGKETEISKAKHQALTIPTVEGCKFVKSRYRARWSGVVVDFKRRTGMSSLYLIIVLRDSRGNIPRKRIIKVLDELWTIEIGKMDLTNVNEEWFDRIPIL